MPCHWHCDSLQWHYYYSLLIEDYATKSTGIRQKKHCLFKLNPNTPSTKKYYFNLNQARRLGTRHTDITRWTFTWAWNHCESVVYLLCFVSTGPMVGTQGVPGSKLVQNIITFLPPHPFFHSFFFSSPFLQEKKLGLRTSRPILTIY